MNHTEHLQKCIFVLVPWHCPYIQQLKSSLGRWFRFPRLPPPPPGDASMMIFIGILLLLWHEYMFSLGGGSFIVDEACCANWKKPNKLSVTLPLKSMMIATVHRLFLCLESWEGKRWDRSWMKTCTLREWCFPLKSLDVARECMWKSQERRRTRMCVKRLLSSKLVVRLHQTQSRSVWN